MRRVSIWILLGSLAALIGVSVHLAITRIYQVDECTELIVARILAMGQAKIAARAIDEYLENGIW